MTFVILAPTLPGPLFAWARATAGERGRQRCTKRLRLSSSSSRRNASSSASASGSELTIGRVRSYLADKLARYKIPKVVEFRSDLPREDSGKIFKRKLKEPFWQNTGRRI